MAGKSVAQKDRQFYLANLKSNECICGREKQPWKSLCYPCFNALPLEMQRSLYRSIGHGYEAAFEEAVGWLQENKWE